jgi:hypothetical protein
MGPRITIQNGSWSFYTKIAKCREDWLKAIDPDLSEQITKSRQRSHEANINQPDFFRHERSQGS